MFGTRTKETGYDAVGLELVSLPRLRARKGGLSWRSVASRSNTRRSVIAAGASAVAVISDLLVTNDPRGADPGVSSETLADFAYSHRW